VRANACTNRFTFTNVEQNIFDTIEKIDTVSVGKISDALFIKCRFQKNLSFNLDLLLAIRLEGLSVDCIGGDHFPKASYLSSNIFFVSTNRFEGSSFDVASSR
jgi:hypothetical protein